MAKANTLADDRPHPARGPADFEAILLGPGGKKLTGPQAGPPATTPSSATPTRFDGQTTRISDGRVVPAV